MTRTAAIRAVVWWKMGSSECSTPATRRMSMASARRRSFDFYSPHVFQHEGRQILLGWMGMQDRDEDYSTSEKGWVFSLSLENKL